MTSSSKKGLLAVAALLTLIGLLLAVWAGRFLRSLDTPEFREAMLERAEEALGTQVRVEGMELSLLSGTRLTGVAVANPPPFRGEILEADALVLRYRLLPLLTGRLAVDRLSLEKPTLRLVMDRRGRFNYETLVPEGPGGGSPASAGARLPLDVVLSRLSMQDATVTVVDHTRASLLGLHDADLSTSLELTRGELTGSGKASVAEISVGEALFVRGLEAPLRLSPGGFALAPVRGRVAGGELQGEVQVLLLAGGPKYVVEVALDGAKVETLIEEARSTRSLAGTLKMTAHFEGTGGLPTLEGRGRAEVADCRVKDAALLELLATALRLPELAQPDFEECRMEFTLARARLSTPVLSLRGPTVRLSGKGTTHLTTQALDFQMSLALAPTLVERIPVREIRAAFQERDGLSALDFGVTGTTGSPKTDLAARLGRAAASEAAKGGIKKIFKKIF